MKPVLFKSARFSHVKLAAVLLLTLFSSSQLMAADQAITIRFSHAVASKTPKGLMARKFKELAEQRLPGKVKVKIYPRSLMYLDSNVGEAIASGKLELAAPALSKLRKYTAQLQVFDLPFLFPDMAAVERFQQSPAGQQLLRSMEDFNITGLGYLHNGMKQMSGNQKIATPRDLQGKTYRVMNSPVLKEQFMAVGAIPEVKPFSQVYALLSSGKIDGQENTWSNIYSSHFFRAQKHITETNHGVLDYMVISSPTFWASLPDDIRSVLKQCIEEAIVYGNQIAAQQNSDNRQAVISSGVTQVATLNEQQRQQWINAMKPVWQEFSTEIGNALITDALMAGQQP